jgi:dCMP deaminase
VRPEWDEYFLDIAVAVASRGNCTRRRCGAVIVKDHRIISTGYNGAPRGVQGCLEGACPRGRHYAKYVDDTFDLGCGCGGPWPCPEAVEPGSSYDTGPGTCTALHAEQNAIIYADWDKCQNATIYITGEPCGGCRKMIEGAGIMEVFWPDGHWMNPQSKPQSYIK